MSGKGKAIFPSSSRLIADRYQVTNTLGKGGMAVVYQVIDNSTNRKLALKQLLAKKEKDRWDHAAAHFEHEFHALCQLSHPKIVQVYEYGVGVDGPYYTMELLDGGDLRERSPLPWIQVCEILRDICSALSLLHSRRLIHRDVSTRNIRCTKDGVVKLIDFGTMVPFGPPKSLSGTPQFAAPEALNRQPLDARTDLFSLGATAYYALTGRHAYPASSFDSLRDFWRTPPWPLAKLVADIPKELNNLVMSLINLSSAARPNSASEVMERVCAIAGLPIDSDRLAANTQLTTPAMQGRESHLLRVRKQMVRALRKRGGAMMVTGKSGVGRSRFLDACALEGMLLGAVVLKADASDGYSGDWGVVATIITQLIEMLPKGALPLIEPYISVLEHILPKLPKRIESHADSVRSPSSDYKQAANSSSDARPSPPGKSQTLQRKRPEIQSALNDLLLRVSNQYLVVIAIDDIHQIDEPSAAFVALLCHESSLEKLVVVTSAELEADATSPKAIELLNDVCATVELDNLGPEDTNSLLTSLFGAVPNTELLANRLYKISQGNPRAVIRLAQYLIDRGVIHYRAGGFVLPHHIDAQSLPNTLDEALLARVQKLPIQSFELAQMLLLSGQQSFSVDACRRLAHDRPIAELMKSLDQLVAAELLQTDGYYYSFTQHNLASSLLRDLPEQKRKRFHAAVARLFSESETEGLRAAKHLFRSGQFEAGLDALIAYSERARVILDTSAKGGGELYRSLSPDWITVYESALTVCKKFQRPRKQFFLLQMTMVILDSVTAFARAEHITQVLKQLYHDSGLEIYQTLDEPIESEKRLKHALELAAQRYEQTPESQRVLTPPEAIREIAKFYIHVIDHIGTSYNRTLLRSLMSLLPFASLSPVFTIMDNLVRALDDVVAARFERARQCYIDTLRRLSEPDRAGLDVTRHDAAQRGCTYVLGQIEAGLGIHSALERASAIETSPLFQGNAWQIRMTYYLRQGDVDRAEQCRKQMELLQIRNSPTQYFERAHPWSELIAYSVTDDLTGIRGIIDRIRTMSDRFPQWVPIFQLAKGEAERIRGDYRGAISEFERILERVEPGEHGVWPLVWRSYLYSLLEIGETQEVREQGGRALAAAEKLQLGYMGNYIRMPLSIAEAKCQNRETALKLYRDMITRYEALEITGIYLGLAYETRARIAILTNDDEDFRVHAKRCAEVYLIGGNPALAAKYDKLLQEARLYGLRVPFDFDSAAGSSKRTEGTDYDELYGRLLSCENPPERAQCALEILVARSNCRGGLLYAMQKHGPSLVAKNGDHPIPSEIQEILSEFLSAELYGSEEVTITKTDVEAASSNYAKWMSQAGEFYPILIGHHTFDGYAITGLAILLIDPHREFQYPNDFVLALSECWSQMGDVHSAFAAV